MQHVTSHPTGQFHLGMPLAAPTALTDLQYVLLHLLSHRDLYGLQLLTGTLQVTRSAGQMARAGDVHPALRALEASGYVTRHLRSTPEDGERRAFYHLTAAGQRALDLG